MNDLNQKIHDMIYGVAAGGVYHKKAGTRTDDTSMVLCLADSLGENDELNPEDIMNRFVKWLDKSEYTPQEHSFDVGQTCMKAIRLYMKGGKVESIGVKGGDQN